MATSEIEDTVKGISFSEQRKDNASRDGRVEHHSKRSVPEVTLTVEGIVG